MINMSDFIEMYCGMILYPIQINKQAGFKLSNSMTILFKDSFITKVASNKLIRHYKKIGIIPLKGYS
jgi:hypothetical protein